MSRGWALARDARASRCTRVSEKRDRGFTGRGGLQMWPVELARSGHARRPSVRRANRRWLLPCRLSLRTPAPTPIAFFRAPHGRLFAKEGLRRCVYAEDPVHKTCAAARARRAKPGAHAPASPERSDGARREDYAEGVGGWMKQNQPTPPALPSAEDSNPRARRAKPGANAPPRQSEASAAEARCSLA